LAKWAVQAHLSDADEIKLGYVSRANPRDPYNHVILSVNRVDPSDFAREIGIDLARMWGILKYIIESLKKLDEGKYLLIREPQKKHLTVYRIPETGFERQVDK